MRLIRELQKNRITGGGGKRLDDEGGITDLLLPNTHSKRARQVKSSVQTTSGGGVRWWCSAGPRIPVLRKGHAEAPKRNYCVSSEAISATPPSTHLAPLP